MAAEPDDSAKQKKGSRVGAGVFSLSRQFPTTKSPLTDNFRGPTKSPPGFSMQTSAR
jgi:hypothetical protein